MKRRGFLILIQVLLLIFLVGGVYYLNCDENVFDFTKEEETEEIINNQVRYKVHTGKIEHTYEVDAKVVSEHSDLYMEHITLSNITDVNFELFKKKGDEIEAGEIFYRFKNEDKSVDFQGKITDVIYYVEGNVKYVVIQLLNYDKLYICADVEYNKCKDINYRTKVSVIYEGKEYQTRVLHIGYEITDGKLPIQVSLPDEWLPGVEVKVRFILDVEEAGMYVSKDAVYCYGNDYYVDRLTAEQKIEQIKITIGQEFAIEEDNAKYEYYEVLSGVNVGDILVAEEKDAIEYTVGEE
ncbi:MAG: hypothetical protein IJP29_04420 [Lachnospiraceae bacterium]|nr:hypothetical protein [Lachnospiraceae bacterium]